MKKKLGIIEAKNDFQPSPHAETCRHDHPRRIRVEDAMDPALAGAVWRMLRMDLSPDEDPNDDEYWLPEPTGRFVKGAYIIDPYYYRMMDMIKRQISSPDIHQYKFVKGAYIQSLKPVEYGAYMEYGNKIC